MQQVGALVHLYVPPDRDKIQSAARAGKVAADRSAEGGLTALTFSDYAKEEDRLELGSTPPPGRFRRQRDVRPGSAGRGGTLSVNFHSLPEERTTQEIVLMQKANRFWCGSLTRDIKRSDRELRHFSTRGQAGSVAQMGDPGFRTNSCRPLARTNSRIPDPDQLFPYSSATPG